MSRENLSFYFNWIKDAFVEEGMNAQLASVINMIIVSIAVIAIITVLDIIVRKFIIQLFKALSNKTKSTFDDYLVKSNFPRYVAHIVPVVVLWYVTPIIFSEYPYMFKAIHAIISLYLVILGIFIFRSILRTARNFSQTKEKYHDKPLESYVQVLMIFAWGVGIFLIINLLTDFNIKSLATLGAASAVLLLIFKDTILGFVASVQVSVNDIVRIGDWITFSKYGADGYVTEINLATVRIQNFDNTFTTIPTYNLIADSFQNWRGMQESEGRRIKRSIFIKQSTVKFLTSEDRERLQKIQLVAPYIEHREKEVAKFNRITEVDKSELINGRNQTNLGVFRNYAEGYIVENELINKDLFLMVRHLAPTDKGIPIEIFCFTYDKSWENYERIQADIFDHLLAAVPYFDLELFESPSGSDFDKIAPKDKH